MSLAEWTPPRLELSLLIDDPEMVQYLAAFGEDERMDRAIAALRIGVVALQRAQGAVDADTVRKESDRLMADVREALLGHAAQVSQDVGKSLAQYLDPATGALPQRLNRLVARDGELDGVLQRHLAADDSLMAKTLAQHLGASSPVFQLLDPKQKDGVISSLEEFMKTAMTKQRQEITGEFSLDNPESALSRLVREMTTQQGKLQNGFAQDVEKLRKQLSLDQEDSALSCLVRQVEKAQRGIVEQFSLDSADSALSRMKRELTDSIGDLAKKQVEFQGQVLEMFATLEERKRGAAAGTRHGHDFEEAMVSTLQNVADTSGDMLEATGNTTGRIRHCKKGDAVATIGPEKIGAGRRVVFEAKEDASYNDAQAVAETEEAMKNRDAEIGVFVFSKVVAPEKKPFRRVGSTLLVVWDSENPASDVYLEAAYSVAAALIASADARRAQVEVDMEALEAAILSVEKQAGRMDGIRKKCESIRNAAGWIDDEARKVGDVLNREVRRLTGQTAGLHEALAK